MTTSDFTVVAMMREPRDIVARFVAYYRQLGAVRIQIYFDGDAGDVRDLACEDVEILVCDDQLLDRVGARRDDAVEQRQWAIALHAFRALRTEWMLFVDADEYVFGDRPMREFLGAIPPGDDVVRLPTAEAVWRRSDGAEAPFSSTAFRCCLPARWAPLRRLIYLRHCSFFSWRGLIGHAEGKQFIRKGAKIDRLTCLHALSNVRPVGRWASQINPEFRHFYLGHFDAIGLDHWREKWRRRHTGEAVYITMSAARRRQMAIVGQALGRGCRASRRLFRRLYGLTPVQFAVLRLLGCAFQRDIFGEMGVAPTTKPAPDSHTSAGLAKGIPHRRCDQPHEKSAQTAPN